MPSRRDQIPSPKVAPVWPHLQKIKDKIMPYQESLEIGLLIGCNCLKAIKPKEVILGKGEDPYAVRTLLGWRIIGPVSLLEDIRYDCGEHLGSSCNRIFAYEVDTGGCSNRSFVLSSQTKKEINRFAVSWMFERGFLRRIYCWIGAFKRRQRIPRHCPWRIPMLFFVITGVSLTSLVNSKEDSWPTEDTVTTTSPSWRMWYRRVLPKKWN